MTDNPAVCAWCDHTITYNPFTRTHKGKLYLLCTIACLNDHYKFTERMDRNQANFNFDVVV